MHVLCLLVDRLHLGFLGPYGNTYIATPGLDRLAAESLLLDAATVDSTDMASLYRAFWQGRHALQGPSPLDWSLPTELAKAGVSTLLVSDHGFDDDPWTVTQVAEFVSLKLDRPAQKAASLQQTAAAQLISEAVDRLSTATTPTLLWAHLASLGTCWDAPPEFSAQYADEEDPTPYGSVEVPQRILPENFDPDERLSILHAYAGEVSALDRLLDALGDFLRHDLQGRETMLVLLSARGLAMGEQRRVGPWDEPLTGSVTQIPWLLRLPSEQDAQTAPLRSRELAQPSDLCRTLFDAWQLAPPAAAGPLLSQSLWPLLGDRPLPLERPCALTRGMAGSRALRTAAWSLYAEPVAEDGTRPVRLFAKPDDRWEVNDVATRCPEVIAQALATLDEAERLVATTGSLADLPELPELLHRGMS